MALPANMERWRGRVVAGVVVAVLVGSAAADFEQWPLTSYRLFSHVRTDEGMTRELVAVHEDGTTATVRFGDSNPVLATTAHLLSRLEHEGPATQRRMAEAELVG